MANEPTVTIVELDKRDKPAGGYKPAQRYDQTLKKYVADYSRRGSYERDERSNKTRVYVHPKEWGVFENLINRRSRPTDLYRKALPAMFEQLGIDPVKANWSQKAGCSCGCSPAFVLDARLGYDVFLTVEVDGADPLVDPAKAGIAANRLEQVLADPTIAPLIGVTE